MRRQYGYEETDDDINMTPMLDIVFIMLIFFIVTASFVKESGIDIQRPSAVTSESKEQASIVVAISEAGEIWIDKRAVDVRSVRANIERLRAENPQGSVVIQADKSSTNGLWFRSWMRPAGWSGKCVHRLDGSGRVETMHRLALSFTAALVMTFSLFFVMESLVAVGKASFEKPPRASSIEFIRLNRDSELNLKARELPENCRPRFPRRIQPQALIPQKQRPLRPIRGLR